MAAPSSQIIAVWVQEEITATEWVRLREVLFSALKRKWIGPSDETLWESVEEHSDYVAELIRASLADAAYDGSPARIEIDNDPSPYVRSTSSAPSLVLGQLRRTDPFKFEAICAAVLERLGATCSVTQRSNDEGVDFIGKAWNSLPAPLSVPAACRSVVIGQAKRYKDGNAISETKLREFVGAATLKRHKLLREGSICPLTPVLFAFWTTSSFDQNAKLYARDVGLWYMDGHTLAAYVTALDLCALVKSASATPIP